MRVLHSRIVQFCQSPNTLNATHAILVRTPKRATPVRKLPALPGAQAEKKTLPGGRETRATPRVPRRASREKNIVRRKRDKRHTSPITPRVPRRDSIEKIAWRERGRDTRVRKLPVLPGGQAEKTLSGGRETSATPVR